MILLKIFKQILQKPCSEILTTNLLNLMFFSKMRFMPLVKADKKMAFAHEAKGQIYFWNRIF